MRTIDKSNIIEEGRPGTLAQGREHFNRIMKNVRSFNGKLLTYKKVNVGNGTQFFIYRNGEKINELSLLSDRYGWELTRTSYKEVL